MHDDLEDLMMTSRSSKVMMLTFSSLMTILMMVCLCDVGFLFCLLMLADAFAVLLPFVDAESDVADVSAVCLLLSM